MDQLQRFSQIHTEKCWPTVEKISPCEDACPLHIDIPSYTMAIAQGRFKEALAIICETNPLPSVCGWVCDHPCEDSCNRATVDEPVAIQWLKRLAAEQGMDEKPTPFERTKKERIAIIGSGPAGLTAAYDLAKYGYGVTIYEALPTPGGILASAIPEFILPKEITETEIDYIERVGVRIVTDSVMGRDFSLDDLWRRGFKAVLIAIGAQKSAKLNIPGVDLEGIFLALPILRSIKSGEKVNLRGKVAVIGGGDVAMDVSRAALRLGANEVHIACLEARRDMPAHSWEIEAAEREGIRIHPSLAPQQFRAKDGRRIGFIDFRRVAATQLDEQGRITWTLREGPGSEYTMEADSIIVAIGQALDPSSIDGSFELTPRGAFAVDSESLATNVPGVFAAGDAVAIAGTVVNSMASGRQAAESIHHYLQGEELRPKPTAPKEVAKIEPEMIPDFLPRKPRWDMPELRSKNAIRSFRPVKLGYVPWEGMDEAGRCLNCKMCASCVFERGQLCFETARRVL